MRTLFIDTTNETLIIALSIDSKLVETIKLEGIREHSVYAVEKIKEILENNKLNPNDIDKIIVVNGPGSFTGIRVGVAIAKTYAYALNKRITTSSSLKNMIIGSSGFDYYVSKIVDKKEKYYVGIYDKNYDTIFEGLISESELEEKLSSLNNYKVVDDTSYDILSVINYYNDKEDINPHKVNPNYLKDVI